MRLSRLALAPLARALRPGRAPTSPARRSVQAASALGPWFCGMGVCFACAHPQGLRTCVPPAAAEVESRIPDPDVVVVGAGPGGLAAALGAADAGAAVTVVDLGAHPGGQYLRGATRHPLVSRAGAHPRITLLQRHEVWSAGPDLSLRVGDRVVRPRAVVLATGGYDRVVPFPGWDLPGVVTAGGAQAMAKGLGVPIGRRVLVAGTGPFLLAVAASLRAVGAEVVAVVEASRLSRWRRHPRAIASSPGRLVEAARYLRGTALWQGQRVTTVERSGEALRALVSPMERWVEVDAVCVGHGFTPSIELAVALGCDTRTDPRDGSLVVAVDDAQRASVPGVFVAGEATGVGGAALAMAEGAIAGLAAAHHIGLIDDRAFTAGSVPHRRRRARRLRFADALHAVYPAPDAVPPDGTVLCRCEKVTVGRARADVRRYGIDDVRALKLLTRVGMGMCQGRMCGRTALALLRAETGQEPDPVAFARRPFVFPVSLGTLAGDEGGGHVA